MYSISDMWWSSRVLFSTTHLRAFILLALASIHVASDSLEKNGSKERDIVKLT
jgi:hypothetical protein